ncbi:MAG: class I SAM-dependent methyltransferase [Armatimonadetes bacterium]|nr:class I SAM-dependent methyltransferase [Armatimonadota bacterium]
MPDYLERTREAWTKMSAEYLEPGRRHWSTDEITWGIWGVPESELGALGDLDLLRGKDVIELGCGTGYVSSWLARRGAKPVGIDPTPAQLANARAFQAEFGIEFPLIEAGAEEVPLPDASFDLAVTEYGASIWADPYLWIPEAARLLRPGGTLVFLRNSPIASICTPNEGVATDRLVRDWFGMNRIEWSSHEPEEFHLTTGPMIRLLRSCGFTVEDLIEVQAPVGAQTRYEYITAEWSRRWPSEEIWRVRKEG